jgi:hypothetical protein
MKLLSSRTKIAAAFNPCKKGLRSLQLRTTVVLAGLSLTIPLPALADTYFYRASYEGTVTGFGDRQPLPSDSLKFPSGFSLGSPVSGTVDFAVQLADETHPPNVIFSIINPTISSARIANITFNGESLAFDPNIVASNNGGVGFFFNITDFLSTRPDIQNIQYSAGYAFGSDFLVAPDTPVGTATILTSPFDPKVFYRTKAIAFGNSSR